MSNRNHTLINPFTGRPITQRQGVESIFGKNFSNQGQKSVMDPGEPTASDYVSTTTPSPVKRAATNDSRPNTADAQQTTLRRSNAVRRKRADSSMDRDEMLRLNKKQKWTEDGPEGRARTLRARDSHLAPANKRRQITQQDLSTRSPLDRLAQDPRHPLRPRAATEATPSAQASRYSWMDSDEGLFQSPVRPIMRPPPPSSRPQLTTPAPSSYRAPQSATLEDQPRPAQDRGHADPEPRRAARLDESSTSRGQLRQLNWAAQKLRTLPTEQSLKRKLELAEARLYEPGSVKKRFEDDLAALRARSNARFKHYEKEAVNSSRR
ncbi:hypothetical protein Hte_007690 [Hypoxylon texense]